MVRKQTYRYWDLTHEIAISDFRLKYQDSVFGYLWSLVKPMTSFAIYFVIFSNVFHVGNSVKNYPLYLFIGIVIFSFWSDATSVGLNSIVSRGGLIRKVYFPRFVLVIASTLTSLFTFLLNMIIVLVFAMLSGAHIGWSALLIFPYIIEMYILVVGVSFYLGALFVKFRDVSHIWEVVNQALFYSAPIVYTLALLPETYAKILSLSPLTQVIRDMRAALLGFDAVANQAYWAFPLWPHLIVIAIVVSGYFLFQKMAVKFAEEV